MSSIKIGPELGRSSLGGPTASAREVGKQRDGPISGVLISRDWKGTHFRPQNKFPQCRINCQQTGMKTVARGRLFPISISLSLSSFYFHSSLISFIVSPISSTSASSKNPTLTPDAPLSFFRHQCFASFLSNSQRSRRNSENPCTIRWCAGVSSSDSST